MQIDSILVFLNDRCDKLCSLLFVLYRTLPRTYPQDTLASKRKNLVFRNDYVNNPDGNNHDSEESRRIVKEIVVHICCLRKSMVNYKLSSYYSWWWKIFRGGLLWCKAGKWNPEINYPRPCSSSARDHFTRHCWSGYQCYNRRYELGVGNILQELRAYST